MKKIIVLMCLMLLRIDSFSQSQEAQQLLLNVEKLAQLKGILRDMYKGYEIVSKGYNTVRDISKGNFNLHEVFLDKMMQVSPAVKQYKKIAEIISYQGKLVKEYKFAFQQFNASDLFSEKEINYMSSVYGHLFNQSLQNLDELIMIITAGKVRMSDEERIKAIDRIFTDMQDKLVFLRSFNKGTKVLAVQRYHERTEVETSRKLNGIR
jgi:hypothetical protein